jgi:RNA recognition motif-containing protein
MILDPEQKTESANGGGRNPNRLYFGNLSFDKGKQDVETIFQDCGQITDIHIIRDRFTQRSQGYGFITFSTNEGKEKAVLKNGQTFFGRQLKVNLEAKSKPDGGRVKTRQRLYVKNIPKETTEEQVKELFAQFGTVENFFFIKDHATNLSRGFGFLDFSNAEEAQAALSMNGQVAFGQTLVVKIAEEKNSGRGRGGGRGGGFGGRGRGYNPYAASSYGYQAAGAGYGAYSQPYGYGANMWNQASQGWQQQGYGYGRGTYMQAGYGGAATGPAQQQAYGGYGATTGATH